MPEDKGEGYIKNYSPSDGLMVSIGDWIPYKKRLRQYDIKNMFFEMTLLESGDIVLVQNGKKRRRIEIGVNIYLNKPSKGRVEYEKNIPIRYVNVLLSKRYVEKHIEKYYHKDYFVFDKLFSWQDIHYNTPEITMIFRQIKSKLENSYNSSLYYEAKVSELLSLVIASYEKNQRNKSQSKVILNNDDHHQIAKIKKILDNNITHSFSIEDLCKTSAMGKTKLRETFKHCYGMTIGSYVIHNKMKYALTLLLDETKSIKEIAQELEYSSASKFTSTFKKHYNITPIEYRKLIKMV